MRLHFKPKGQPELSQQVDDNALARVCLSIAGGGFTESQTKLAMETQQQLRDGQSVATYRGTWRLTA